MKNENQLDFVRVALDATPRSEWEPIASAAGMSARSMYKIVNDEVDPKYKTVYKLYCIFKNRKASKREASDERSV